MKRRVRIIYILIALLASQSVWSMLDEHGISNAAPTTGELRHDGHAADDQGERQHADDAESCIHCCHCHFHQISYVPPSESSLELAVREATSSGYSALLTEAYPNTPFRPPIL